jgi:hypothetical protein
MPDRQRHIGASLRQRLLNLERAHGQLGEARPTRNAPKRGGWIGS